MTALDHARVAFTLDGEPVSAGEALWGAFVSGALAAPLERLRRRLACERFAPDADVSAQAVQAVVDAWRRRRRLEAAGDLKDFLAAHGLERGDLLQYALRVARVARLGIQAARAAREAAPAPAELLAALPRDLAFEGDLEDVLAASADRHAAAAPVELDLAGALAELCVPAADALDAAAALGVDPDRAAWLARGELGWRRRRAELLEPALLEAELAARRADLEAFRVEEATCPDEDVALELLCCARHDGESWARALGRARLAAVERTWLRQALHRAPYGQHLGSAAPGELVGPSELPGGQRAVAYVVERAPASLEVDAVRAALEERVLRRETAASRARLGGPAGEAGAAQGADPATGRLRGPATGRVAAPPAGPAVGPGDGPDGGPERGTSRLRGPAGGADGGPGDGTGGGTQA